jgi:hypothetical protein
MLDVLLGRLNRVVRGVMKVALCGVSVMRCHFVVVGRVMCCGLAMMTRCVLVVFGCFLMMLCGLLGHESSCQSGSARLLGLG